MNVGGSNHVPRSSSVEETSSSKVSATPQKDKIKNVSGERFAPPNRPAPPTPTTARRVAPMKVAPTPEEYAASKLKAVKELRKSLEEFNDSSEDTSPRWGVKPSAEASAQKIAFASQKRISPLETPKESEQEIVSSPSLRTRVLDTSAQLTDRFKSLFKGAGGKVLQMERRPYTFEEVLQLNETHKQSALQAAKESFKWRGQPFVLPRTLNQIELVNQTLEASSFIIREKQKKEASEEQLKRALGEQKAFKFTPKEMNEIQEIILKTPSQQDLREELKTVKDPEREKLLKGALNQLNIRAQRSKMEESEQKMEEMITRARQDNQLLQLMSPHTSSSSLPQMEVSTTQVTNICYKNAEPDKQQQDRFFNTDFSIKINGQSEQVQLMGIADGHGGNKVSDYIEKHFPLILQEELSQLCKNGKEDSKVWTAINNAVHRIEDDPYVKEQEDGATFSTMIFLGDRVHTANLGDSGWIACGRKGKQIPLTRDQSPDTDIDKKAIEKRGGEVIGNKVSLPTMRDGEEVRATIATAGSIGDHKYIGSNGVKVLNTRAEICSYSLDEIRKMTGTKSGGTITFIGACDGLWDCCPKEVVANSLKTYSKPEDLSLALTMGAASTGQDDNITVTVAQMRV